MKRTFLLILVTLFCGTTSVVFSQSETETIVSENSLRGREARKTEISANFFGPSFIAINFEKYLTNLFEFNLSLGYGISAGLNIHFLDNKETKKWSPYLGINMSTYRSIDISLVSGSESDDRIFGLYNPLGIKYIGNGGFTFSIEGAAYTTFGSDGGVGSWFGIKTGYRF